MRIDHAANMKTVFPILIVSISYVVSCICVVLAHSIVVITMLLTIVYTEPLFVMLFCCSCFWHFVSFLSHCIIRILH